MDYDTMVINDGNSDKTIYILVEINQERHYIIYTDKILNNYSSDDIYVGEVVDNRVIPVPFEMLGDFDRFIKRFLK